MSTLREQGVRHAVPAVDVLHQAGVVALAAPVHGVQRQRGALVVVAPAAVPEADLGVRNEPAQGRGRIPHVDARQLHPGVQRGEHHRVQVHHASRDCKKSRDGSHSQQIVVVASRCNQCR